MIVEHGLDSVTTLSDLGGLGQKYAAQAAFYSALISLEEAQMVYRPGPVSFR